MIVTTTKGATPSPLSRVGPSEPLLTTRTEGKKVRTVEGTVDPPTDTDGYASDVKDTQECTQLQYTRVRSGTPRRLLLHTTKVPRRETPHRHGRDQEKGGGTRPVVGPDHVGSLGSSYNPRFVSVNGKPGTDECRLDLVPSLSR